MRSFTALVNPLGSRDLWLQVEPLLRAAGAEVTVELTESAADAIRRAEKASSSTDVVLAVGGDGLVRDVAGGVVTGGGILGIVPSGRGNDFANTVGIPREPQALADLLLNAEPRAIDVLDADGVIVTGNVFCGVDSLAAHIGNQMRWLRWLPGGLVYEVAALVAFARWHPPTYTVTMNGRTESQLLHGVLAANSGTYGGGIRIAPTAALDDGRILVQTLDGTATKRDLVGVMLAAKKDSSHIDLPALHIEATDQVTIAADRPVPLNADGDEIGELPVTVTVKPGALQILAP